MSPTISIITVTKSRPRFIRHLRHNIESLDYDQSLIEWVVVDDGEDPVLEYVEDFPNVLYRHSAEHIPLGKKRNLANSLASGEFLFCFDDDNYAFPSRIRKAVNFLDENPEVCIAGSTEMFILDIDIGKIYVAGPFAKSHATLGTWAFRRSLLNETAFIDTDTAREEHGFTKEWTMRIGQMDKYHTSVSVDHGKNTISKKHLLNEATAFFPLSEIVQDKFSLEFFEKLISEKRTPC